MVYGWRVIGMFYYYLYNLLDSWANDYLDLAYQSDALPFCSPSPTTTSEPGSTRTIIVDNVSSGIIITFTRAQRPPNPTPQHPILARNPR